MIDEKDKSNSSNNEKTIRTVFSSHLGYYHRETQSLRYYIFHDSKAISQQNGFLIEIDNKLAYKDMNPWVYYPVTILQVFFIAFCACVAPNIEIVLLICSAISTTFLSFFLPAVLYLMAVRRNQRLDLVEGHNNRNRPNQSELIMQAWIILIIGCFVIVFGLIDAGK